jgi:hypothetical protein
MSGGLQLVEDDSPERCFLCGALAVGPCARCKKLVCGDCCVLTEASARTWAICLRCEKRGGRSLAPAWLVVGAWVLGPTVAIALLLVVLSYLVR